MEAIAPGALRRIALAAGLFAVAFAATPFAVTGAYIVAPWVSTSAPLVALLVLGAAAWLVKPSLRPVAAGVVAGTVAHGAFLWWLFSTVMSLPD